MYNFCRESEREREIEIERERESDRDREQRLPLQVSVSKLGECQLLPRLVSNLLNPGVLGDVLALTDSVWTPLTSPLTLLTTLLTPPQPLSPSPDSPLPH